MPKDASTVTLRRVTAADLDAVIALNDAALPAVNALPRAEWVRFVDEAPYFRVAETAPGRIAGFLVGMSPDIDYASQNFQWFRQRFEDFFYIDRIVIAEEGRGFGLGRRFYEDVLEVARTRGIARLCAEVNSRPPNPVSMGFHTSMGFEPVGEQETENGAKAVVLFSRDVA